MTVGAAILAAGASRRLGTPKQLLPYRGTTLLRATVYEVLAAGCRRVAVVLGAHAGRIAPTVVELPVELVANPLWPEGMAASIRCAAGWALRACCDALVLAVCDQPQLRARHLDALIAQHRATRRPVGSRYAGGVGVPAVFGLADLPRLFALAGDRGARHLLLGADAIDWPAGAHDVDTIEAYEALGQRAALRPTRLRTS